LLSLSLILGTEERREARRERGSERKALSVQAKTEKNKQSIFVDFWFFYLWLKGFGIAFVFLLNLK